MNKNLPKISPEKQNKFEQIPLYIEAPLPQIPNKIKEFKKEERGIIIIEIL